MKLIKVIVAPGAYIFWKFEPDLFKPFARYKAHKAGNPYGEWIWVGREAFNGK